MKQRNEDYKLLMSHNSNRKRSTNENAARGGVSGVEIGVESGSGNESTNGSGGGGGEGDKGARSKISQEVSLTEMFMLHNTLDEQIESKVHI